MKIQLSPIALIRVVAILSLTVLTLGSLLLQDWFEERSLERARKDVAAHEEQRKFDAESRKLQPLIDEFGIIGAADANAKGMTAAEYRRLKEAAGLKRELDRMREQ
jgi:hypothetical protein